MADVTYPYDSTGIAPSNLIVNEQQVLSLINGDAYRYFIPSFAPFYQTNFSLTGTNGLGNAVVLKEGVDFEFTAKYIGPSRANGKMVQGAISIINQDIQGHVSLTYQCLGGPWSANRNFVIQTIAENNYNPRRIAWDQVTNAPTVFPPTTHPQPLDTFTGMRDLIDAINGIKLAPRDDESLRKLIWDHIFDLNDPHDTRRFMKDFVTQKDIDKSINDLLNQEDPFPQYFNRKRLLPALERFRKAWEAERFYYANF